MKKIIASLLMILAICYCVNFIPSKVFADDDTFMFESVVEEAAALTATDELEGVIIDEEVPTIKDFKQGLLSWEFSLSEIKACLPCIIPQELLYHEGNWYYEGEEYTFYIETNLYFDTQIGKCVDLELLLIDYTFIFNENEGYIKTSVDIFAQCFQLALSDNDFFVLVNFSTNERYLLKDIKFLQGIANEHDYNYEDENYYSKRLDNGVILRNTSLSYSGVSKRGNWDVIEDVGGSLLSCGLGIIPIFGDIISIIDTGLHITEVVADEAMKTAVYNDNIDLDIYPTREQQLNDSKYQTFIKAIQIDSFLDEGESTEVFINDYASILTILSDSVLETRAVQQVQYKIYRTSSAGVFYLNENGEFVEENETYKNTYIKLKDAVLFEKDIELTLGNNNGYLLSKDSVQDFTFTPIMNGMYGFTTNENYLIEIIGDDEIKQFENNGLYRLIANKSYQIKVKFVGKEMISRPYVLNIDFVPEIAVLGNNTITFIESNHEFLALDFSENGYYTFTVENVNYLITLYDEDFNIIEENKVEITARCENQKYYLKITSAQIFSGSTVVTCEKYCNVNFVTNTEQVLEDYHLVPNAITQLPTPLVSPGYEFLGWWLDSECINTEITAKNIDALNLADITLYAKWRCIIYNVIYNENGGESIIDGEYTVLDNYILYSNPQRENNVFIGWYENPDFSGNKVTYIPAGTIGNKQFYAKWVIAKHNVTLDVGSAYTGATIAYTECEVMYGNEYTLPIPTYNGYEFNGWTYNGELVSDSQGSLIFLIEEENVTLMASWSPINFYIKIETIDNESTVKYLTTNGIVTTSETVTIEDFKNEVSINHFCPNCWAQENREVFYREGHVFDALYYEGSLACWSILMPSITENVEIILTANYIKEEYIINFSNFTAEEVQPLIIEFGCNIEWYEFVGYECVYRVADSSLNDNLSEQFVKGEIFDYDKMPDISVGYESVSNSVIYIELEKTALITRLNLIDEEESYITSIAYDSATANVEIPYKTGYKFIGWFEFLDGSYTIVFDSNGNYVNDVSSGKWNRLDTDLTLYSQYTEIIYYVEYMANSGYGQVEKSEHVYGVSKELTINSYYKEHYSFVGWATSPNGAIEYHDEEVVLNLTAEEGDTIVLYAVWKANKYNIICANLLEYMDLSVKKYTYGVGLTTMPELYRTSNDVPMVIDTLYGWYSDSAFTIPVTSISPTSAGDITLYAKYDYKLFSSSLSGSYVINSKEESTPSLELNIHMKSIYYEQLQGTGLNKIKIQVTFDYYEEDDGYQHLYLYKGSTLIEDVEIDKSNKLDSEINKVVVFELLDVHDYKDTDYLYLKFGVTGWWPNECYISNIRVTAWIIN